MAILLIEKGKKQGLRYEVPDDVSPTILGRDLSSDVVLDDDRASRQHAKVFRERGKWVLEDMGSRNGIIHDGEMVRRLTLYDGETFQIGGTTFAFREDERVDPLAGMEIQGVRLVRLLWDEAGALCYRAQQLAMDRPVRIDVLHPRLTLVSPAPGAAGEMERAPADLVPFLRSAVEAALQVRHPRVNPLIRAEIPDERGSGHAILRWSDAPPLMDVLPEFFKLSLPVRIACFRRLVEGSFARSAEALSYPIGLRHILLHPEEGPMVQALELSALIALLRGHAADLPAFPAFLPPEQSGKSAGPSRAALVYNIGAIGYLLLTRAPPMGEGTIEQVLERHRNLPPAPADLTEPDLPASVSRILSQMLEKDPSRRPGSFEEVLQAIPARIEGAEKVELARVASSRPQAQGPRPGAIRGAAPAQAAREPARAFTRPPARMATPKGKKGGMPVAAQIFFWPALWAALIFGGRFLMRAILERMQP